MNMIKKDIFVWIIVLILAFAIIVVYSKKSNDPSGKVNTDMTATSTATTTSTSGGSVNTTPSTSQTTTSLGDVTMSLYRSTKIGNDLVIPWAVTEDSRCPLDAICIQAGRVKVAMKITPSTSSEGTIREIGIGDSIEAGGHVLMLKEVQPYPVSTKKTQDGEYRIIFSSKAK